MSIHEAAGAVVALINSKPTSPTQAEIEAVLARTVFAGDDGGHEDPLALAWERARAAFAAGCADPAREDDDANEVLADRLNDATLAIWRRWARSVADLALFARVARYWQWDGNDPDLDADFKENLVLSPLGLDAQSLAQLVNATLEVTGGIGARGPDWKDHEIQECPRRSLASSARHRTQLLQTAILVGLKDDVVAITADSETGAGQLALHGHLTFEVRTDSVADAWPVGATSGPQSGAGPQPGHLVLVDPEAITKNLKDGCLVVANATNPDEPDRTYTILRQFIRQDTGAGLLMTNRPGSGVIFGVYEHWIDVEIIGAVVHVWQRLGA